MAEEVNIASFLGQQDAATDSRQAIVIPLTEDAPESADQITFADLRQRVARLQAGLSRAGLRRGDRVVLLFPVCVDFYALALALLASGLVVVLLDGRLDRKRLLRVLSAARPRAIVSVRPLLRLWPILPALWGVRRILHEAAPRPCLGAQPFSILLADGDTPEVALQPADASALLSFTSGSTGNPKGVDRTHGILWAQHLAIKGHAPDRRGEVDMPCFPAVVLHNLTCGIPSVLPPIDLRHPGAADPARVVQAMTRFGVNSMSGAPAFLARLSDYVLQRQRPMPELRRLVIGGAPVSRRLSRRLLQAFPRAEADAAYGSTEAEPMATVSLQELADSAGEGYLVGRDSPAAELALVNLPEIAPALGPDGLGPHRVPAGHPGEVLVRGAHVNRGYIGDDDAVRRYKVPDPGGGLWHRTGDLARRDATDRLWLVGRAPDRVIHGGQAVDPYVIEAALDEAIPLLRGAALVSHPGAPEGEVVVCCDAQDEAAVLSQARLLLDQRGLGRAPLRRLSALPTDARHNSKIDRPTLRELLARSARAGGAAGRGAAGRGAAGRGAAGRGS